MNKQDNNEPKSYPKWVEFLYGPFFSVIGFFYRTYTANRARFTRLTASQKVSSFLRFLAVAILLVWILVWLFASDESRSRLSDEIKKSLGGVESRFDR